MNRWLAFDIGCIECGEPSDVIGVYDTEEEANAAAVKAAAWQKEHWDGEHRFEVYDLSPQPDTPPSN